MHPEVRVVMPRGPGLRFRATALALLVTACVAPIGWSQPVPLLPDITVRRSDLFDSTIVTDIVPGRRHLKLSNGTPNIGEGDLQVQGVFPVNTDGTQTIVQRIFHSDGSFTERPAGHFVFHPGHDHIHVADWCQYRLRRVLEGDGVGEVVAEGAKVSFCILDLVVHDARLSNFRRTPRFGSCGSTVQGLSVGWADIYHRDLPGQNIDITGVPDGFYWLESEVDPEDHILELDEENNIARIKVTIGNPPSAPDLFEPNDVPADFRDRGPGAPNSPDLGPTNPKRVIANLSIHRPFEQDYFRFYIPSRGDERALVRIDFSHESGNLQLAIHDTALTQLRRSLGTSDSETVSLEGLGEGTYYARVFGNLGAVSPEYRLTVVPPRNEAPVATVLEPGVGDLRLLHGSDAFAVRWSHTDPEDNQAWVTVFLDSDREGEADELLLPTSLNTPADLGLAVINSAEVSPGTYWVLCAITDGGATARAWSGGTITFIEPGEGCRVKPGSEEDCNGNFILDRCELDLGVRADCNGNGIPDECDIAAGSSGDRDSNRIPDECEEPLFHRGDANADGSVNIADALSILSYLFLGATAPGCSEAASVKNGSAIDITDGIALLGYLFLGEAPPPPPGPAPLPCGADPDPPSSPNDLGCESYEACD